MNFINELPKAGYCGLSQIIGNKNAKPKPIPAIVPVSKSTWYKRVKNGIYPKPIHAGRFAMWKWKDIRELVEKIEKGDSNA